MDYYEDNKSKLLKKAHEKYHNGGGKKSCPVLSKNKKWIKERERDSIINHS